VSIFRSVFKLLHVMYGNVKSKIC